MRVVIDTNVVVSAILRDRIPEKILLFIIARLDCEWIASPEILKEYREVLRRPKFGLPETILENWEERFCSVVAEWPVEETISFPRDIADAKFLACALAANVDFFITGDNDFSGIQKIENTKIISVGEFNRLVCEPLSK